MPEPTGNRWRDPDTGEIANPGNIQLDTYQGKDAAKRKYGPAVLDPRPEEAEPVAEQDPSQKSIAAAEAARQGISVEELERRGKAAGDELPEIHSKLGTAFDEQQELRDPGPPEAEAPHGPPFDKYEDYETVIATIKEMGPRGLQGDAGAMAELNKIAEAEYGRDDGGRMPIKKRLASYGVGRPKK